MSTIAIAFTAIDPGQGGYVDIGFNDNSTVHQLKLTSIAGPTVYLRFSEIPTTAPSDPDAAQAQAYAYSFNRDFKNVGGANNLSASAVGNVVTITATIGTFATFAKTGNFATNNGIVNSPQSTAIVLTVTRSASTGDCNNIQYTATASGGTAPYTLNDGLSNVATGWNGSAFNFNIARTRLVAKVTVTDAVSAIKSTTFPVPRVLLPGDFSISTINYESSSDITVNRDTVIAGTAPLTYSLDNISESTGQNYQSSNQFAGVAAGQYKLFITDAYGCEISKTITVTGFQDTTVDEPIRYFDIPEGQSFIFTPYTVFDEFTKKNYFNTGSYNESSMVRYQTTQVFTDADNLLGVQFKSSYDYHIITLHQCSGGSPTDITPIMISENLGVKEKMDCVLFPIEGQPTKSGVYFNGGNTYTPDTTTVLGSSSYDGTTPNWAKVGQLIFIDGLGGFTIESVGYDLVRGGYFVITTTTSTDTVGKIQATYNKHPYNLFEFFIDIRDITTKAFVVVERGFDGDNVDGEPWISEVIENRTDDEDRLLIEWRDNKNKGGIVFQSGISFRIRPYGELIPDSDDGAETYDGDSNVYSIEQKSKVSFELLLEGITFKQCMQLNIASGLGIFMVNGLKLVRTNTPEKIRHGKSNLWTWRCKFGFGANQLAIQSDEIVLSPSTGVVGGGSTGKGEVLDLTGTTLYKLPDGRFVKIDGNLINA